VGHGAPSGVAVDGKIGSGKVGTGAFPYGGTYDPVNQEVYIANQDGVDGDNVTVLNGTTGRHVTDISTGGFDPLGASAGTTACT
jgi:DNA-binding beta-propeller fold protein YncE